MPTTHPISHPVTHSDTTGHQAFAQHTPAYLALSVNAHTHALEVRCSFVPAPGKQAGVAEAMALDLVNAAHKRGATVVPPGCTGQLNAHWAFFLASALLNPEELGHSATPEMRGLARMAMGMSAAESGPYRITAA